MNDKTMKSAGTKPASASPSPPKAHRELAAQVDSLAKELGLSEGPRLRSKHWIMRIGDLLREARAAQQILQTDMAAQAEIVQPYLSRLENGLPESAKVIRGPTADVLLRCADALKCDIEIALRSKTTRQIIGSISSAELDAPESSVTIERMLQELLSATDATEGNLRHQRSENAALIKKLLERTPLTGSTRVKVQPRRRAYKEFLRLRELAQELAAAGGHAKKERSRTR
jgi:transcriptional regulator with XRE-family HTH domain